jgi:hypothetical protein
MLPAIAAHAVATYTAPGELVVDPMCGIGTTLVEAAHLGRDAIGVEFESRWADIAAANLALARAQGATGRGMVVRGDATGLAGLIPAALRGRVALVVTSPPYGPTVHGHVRPTPAGVVKSANRYSDAPDPANLAHRDWPGLLDGFTRILAGCAALLRPGGMSATTRSGTATARPSGRWAVSTGLKVRPRRSAPRYTRRTCSTARWIGDNRSPYGLLPSGWSAEHVGDKDKPHYWDDLWGLAGLYEAARLAERVGAAETAELWAAFDDLKAATANSIRWVLGEQRSRGMWETFVPTGPGDVGRLDSTIVGALCYFHPCRLYAGAKLGEDIDQAFRLTLETIWSHFVRGGFRHDSAWHAYGPYLTLQVAHAFLLLGDQERMDASLGWTVGNAAFARISRHDGADQAWQVATGSWNEQHAYPVASGLPEVPDRWWYMGDIPHGWAAAEFTLLVRDMLFFEAGEDDDRHIYLAPGILPRWLAGNGGHGVNVASAPTTFGVPFGYSLQHDEATRRVTIDIPAAPAGVRFVYPCRLGAVTATRANGVDVPLTGGDVQLPAGTTHAEISYG